MTPASSRHNPVPQNGMLSRRQVKRENTHQEGLDTYPAVDALTFAAVINCE